MKPYQSRTPRLAIGLAAFALTALTFGVGVVAPASTEGADRAGASLAGRFDRGFTEVAIVPGRIDVIVVRAASVAGNTVPGVATRSKQQG